MARPGCNYADCPFDPIPTWQRIVVAVFIAAVILFKPLTNGLSISADEAVSTANIVMKFSFVVPVVALLLTAVYANYHAVAKSHFPFFCLDMFSVPGIFLGVFLIASKG